MYRIINQDAIPRIIAGIRLAEKVLEEHPELAEDFAQCTSFKGISQQIDGFAHPTGLVWYLAGYNTKIKAPICESIPVNIKQYEYVKVRKDIQVEIMGIDRDQWGVWLTIGGHTVAQEDGTRSFLDALIKSLQYVRETYEWKCQDATQIACIPVSDSDEST